MGGCHERWALPLEIVMSSRYSPCEVGCGSFSRRCQLPERFVGQGGGFMFQCIASAGDDHRAVALAISSTQSKGPFVASAVR